MNRGLAPSRTAAARIRFAPMPAYLRRLLTFLRRQGRSHEDAEDLIQEAMLRSNSAVGRRKQGK